LPEEEATKNTYDESAAVWTVHRSQSDFWLEELKIFHKLLPNGSILEIGSGAGRDVENLVNLGYKYTGTDISEGMLKIARQKFPKQKFYRQSVYDLSFPKEFDGFWAAAVLLHIPKSRMVEALGKIRNTMKPGAVGFISLKDGSGENLQEDDFGDKKLRRFYSYWTKDEFINVLEVAEYELLEYSYKPNVGSTKENWYCFFVKTL